MCSVRLSAAVPICSGFTGRSHSSVSFVFCSTLVFSSRTFACCPLSGYAGDGSLLRSNRGAGVVVLWATASQHSGKCICEFRIPWHSRFSSGIISGVLAGFLVVSCGAHAGILLSEFSPNAFHVFFCRFFLWVCWIYFCALARFFGFLARSLADTFLPLRVFECAKSKRMREPRKSRRNSGNADVPASSLYSLRARPSSVGR